MRSAILLLVLALANPLRAQTYLITGTGTLSAASGTFASVPAGTVFDYTQIFHVATATLTASSATSTTYTDPDATISFTFGSFTLTGTATELQITSGALAGNTPVYGFEFTQPEASGGFAIQLISESSTDAPSTSLTSLNSLQAAPFSDFQNSLNLTGYYDGSGDNISGRSTSISVQVIAAPEPSSFALSVLGVALMGGLYHHRLQKRKAT